MNDRLSLLHSELEILESETFEVVEYSDQETLMPVACTTSTTSSCTSCSGCSCCAG